MFFNQYDIVQANDVNYLVVSVENETLLVLNTSDMSYREINKDDCKRINTITEIRTRALTMKQAGTFPKTAIKRSVKAYLAKCKWIENASLNHRINSMLLSIIDSMDSKQTFDPNVVEDFFNTVNKLGNNDKANVMISGTYDNVHVSIKVSLVNKGGYIGVNHVKRIFGFNGVFGDVEKSTDTKSKSSPRHNTNRSVANSQKSRLAS